ncbi:hypothetical protein FS795_19300 [Agrobacterium vitis]|nr:hypothetical protein [Allorhizobium ampelinum]
MPGISPSRGEIEPELAARFTSSVHSDESRQPIRRMSGYVYPISPLEGEMSGRTEGVNGISKR